MPSTSRERRLEVQRSWYARNNPSSKEQVVAAKRRYQARNRAIVDEALAERCPCGLADENHLTLRRLAAHRVARRPSSVAAVRAVIEGCPNR
jgi:hypothetical protein